MATYDQNSSDENHRVFSDFADLMIDQGLHSGSDRNNLPSYNWQPITDEFLSACKDLSLGELLHDDMFGLFEAMSAIEMMDPKMDAGMHCNRSKGRTVEGSDQSGGIQNPLTFVTALGTRYMPTEEVPLADQIGVVDMTLSCLVTWLEGHSLAQTVFTNLYLHAPLQVNHPLLSGFSVMILKLVDLIRDLVSRGSVFEEEDFQALVYGFKLCQDVSEQRCASNIREVEDDLQKILRSTRAKPEEQERDPATEQQHELAGALFSRLRFIRLLYQGLAALSRHEIVEGQKFLSACKDQLPNFTSTLELGTQASEGKNIIGFEPLANQRLLPPTFPRYTEIRSRKSTLEYLPTLVERLLASLSIVHVTSFHGALEFFMEFSASSPCILSRSLLQVLYQPLNPSQNTGNLSTSSSCSSLVTSQVLRELLKESCKSFIAPTVLTTKSPPLNGKQIRDCVDNFFGQCGRPMIMLLQTFGHNRARQRDKIPSLLEELALVQEEADKLDTMLNAILAQSAALASAAQGGAVKTEPSNVLFFSTWLLYHVLRLMVRYILSGFELELFSIHEYPYLYWYLYELLYPWLTTCLHRADTHLAEYEYMLETQKAAAGKSKRKVKSSNKKKSRPFAREITCYQGYATLCAGYFKLIVGLKKEKKIMIPNCCFDNEAIRYEHRFSPFNNLLTPPSMPYSQYLEIYEHTARSEPNLLYLSAARDFGRARQIFESVLASAPPPNGSGQTHFEGGCWGGNSYGEVATLISITKNNLVASSILSKDSTREIDFEFGLHATFPTVKLI